MRKIKSSLYIGALALLALLSFGCHGANPTGKMRFVNQTDNSRIVEFTLENPGVLARVHMAVFNARIRGRYVLSDAGSSVEGRVTQNEKGYTLDMGDGKKKHFNVETTGSLKDEQGGVWKLDSPTTTALKPSLKEW